MLSSKATAGTKLFGARAALARAALLVGLAGLGPALQAAPPDPIKALERAAKANDEAALVEAIDQLRQAPSEKGVKALLKVGAMFPSAEVYVAARDALAAATGEAEREELLKGLKARQVEVRTLCADALGSGGTDAAVAPLGEALQDKELPVRVAAIRGLSRLARKACIPLLFERLGQLDMAHTSAEVEELFAALKALTGQELTSLEDWRKYYETLPDDFDPRNRQKGAEGATRQREGAGRIFDSVVRSNRFVLVLDISNSMRVIDLPEDQTRAGGGAANPPYRDPGSGWPPDPQSRFVRARTEFVEFLKNLDGRTQFTILVFGDEPDTKLWRPQLTQANEGNKKDAIQFVEALRWSSATRTDVALQRVFEVPGADTVYMFSDGIPERAAGQAIDQAEVLKLARTLNRVRKMRLHVHGFATASAATRAFLRQLAEENDGEYKDIR